jgi:hypothetical protein
MLLYKAEALCWWLAAALRSGKRSELVPNNLIPKSVVGKVDLKPQQKAAIEDSAAQLEGAFLYLFA